ncbi:helix-turn-helix domain-containing protein [Halosegnis marinus]|uniref:helix-turn-helix domain-containing protein n=1 Tax=Halosegnis marinus TaxID=3034023 RepID=UPI00361EB324
MRVAFEREVPLSPAASTYARVSNADRDWVERRLPGEDGVAGVDVLDADADDRLVRIAWDSPVAPRPAGLPPTDATCLDAVGTDDGWRLALRFPDRDALADWYRRCGDRGIDVDVRRLREDGGTATPDGRLTDRQRTALATALDAGYFEVPRGVTLGELAARLGVSDTAASQRLRRGVSTLVEGHLG